MRKTRFSVRKPFFFENRGFFAEKNEKSRFFARKNAVFSSEKRAFSRKPFPDAKRNFRDLPDARPKLFSVLRTLNKNRTLNKKGANWVGR